MPTVASVRLTSTIQSSLAKSLMSVLASFADNRRKRLSGAAEPKAGSAASATTANIEEGGDGQFAILPRARQRSSTLQRNLVHGTTFYDIMI